MEQFIEKLIGRLEEETYDMEICEEQFDMNSPYFMDVEYKMVKIDDAKEIVNQLAEEYKGGWIACSERLPEEYGEYLVCNKYGVYGLGFPHKDKYGNIYVETESEYITEVIAWQPLPEPYNTEGE